ncbi:MAG: NADH-quinone oxidoreductase subunit C [Candidatus Diapherotrites archaeon]
MNPEELINKLKTVLDSDISNFKVSHTLHGKNKTKAYRVWVDVEPNKLHSLIKKISLVYRYPHFSVSSGYDAGDHIEVLYHFALNYGRPRSQIVLTLRTSVSKNSPILETITDIIPGAEISEKEKREFFGVEFKGLKKGHAFLDESFNSIYPWRRDEKDASKMVKNVHVSDKNAQGK